MWIVLKQVKLYSSNNILVLDCIRIEQAQSLLSTSWGAKRKNTPLLLLVVIKI